MNLVRKARRNAHLPVLVALGSMCACSNAAPNGPPARLIGGSADTVIINHRREVRIPVRVIDAYGHVLPGSGVRYRQTSGEETPLSIDGMVTCAHSADVSVEASLGRLSTIMLVRCRPVKKIHISGPIQFLLPDTAQEMQLRVLDLDGNEITLLKGTS